MQAADPDKCRCVINWITVKRFCALSGYTVDAVDAKRAGGVWLEGQVWKKAPDNRILISVKGYEEWVEGRLCAPQARQVFKSVARTGEKESPISDER